MSVRSCLQSEVVESVIFNLFSGFACFLPSNLGYLGPGEPIMAGIRVLNFAFATKMESVLQNEGKKMSAK